MKIKLKRIFSAVLSLALVGCMVPTTAVTISADEPVQEITAKANVQDGVILHCFDWSFNTIKANMAAIAEAGYTAVQTSPIQQCKQATRTNGVNDSNADWWLFYQPVTFTIDNTGTSALGTKEEFTQMCEEAHNYGIHVIVDVVANHLGNDGDYTKSSAIADNIRNNSAYWHTYWNEPANHDIREQSINYSLGGLPDLNTENADIQEMVLDYLKECIDAGADGFRFDAAKHIGVDADGEQYTFWKNTIPAAKTYYQTRGKFANLYCYGEVLGDTQTKSYVTYLDALTDTVGNGIRNSVASHSASGASSSSYWNNNLNTNQKVLWAESHDTYSNDTKESTYISDSDINKTWALVASRAEATALYFARTDGYRGGTMGDACSDEWKSAEVSAVNRFHNIFGNRSEYLSNSGSIAYNERGTKGIVLVNVNGNAASVNVPVNRIADGTYTDQITKNTFTVANGRISGNIGSTGIAVVYNPDDTEEPYIKSSVIYMRPNDKWVENHNERFAMYLWNASGEAWANLTDTDGDGTYSGDVPSGKWTGIIFCRMDGSATENNWDNKWNKTVDLFPDENTNRYTLKNGVWNETEETKGTWDLFGHIHSYGDPVWDWADDYSSVTATFSCSGCDVTFTATDSAPETDYISNIRTHTASVTGPDGEEYPCTAYEPMVVQEEPEGGVEYQKANAELLNEIYEATMAHEEEINIYSYGLPVSEGAYITKALQNIYPELFFVDFFGYYYSGDDLYSIVPVYNMDKEEADEKVAAFYAKAEEYLSLIDDSMDDFTKALILHDQLVLNNHYTDPNSSNYTFMIEGWGRCENYTEVYAYLLARVGIKSEIVSSSSMGHEWMMVCLDGQYYHVDVTWDDPYSTAPIAVSSISNRPDKVRRTFFLLSDTLIQDSSYNSKTHNYYNNYNKATDVSYDSYTKLHGNENLICYVNGELYTLYKNNNNKGVIAVYNPVDDTYTDKYVIDNLSAAGGGYWTGNFSSIAECNGLLYFNGEHTINIYDPATGSVQTYYTYNAGQLYGMYIQDGQIYGLTAPDPNSEVTVVSLTSVQTRTYTVRWVNYDGSELEKDENVTEGTMPSYDGAEPTRQSDTQYDYTFSGWTPDVTAVTGNITYTANYTPSLRKYTVVWQDYNNTLLETDSNVPYGTTPTYSGTTPTRDGYTFKGWNPEVTTVTGDAVYTAEYDVIPTGILITEYNFANWDEVYIYYWNDTSEGVKWPGVEMNPADNDNFKFTYSIPSDMTKIIFNNGYGKPQTENLSLTNGTEWSVSLTGTTVNANSAPTYYLIGSMNNWTQNDTSYTFVPNMNENGFEEYVLTTELSANDAVKVFGGTNYYPSGGGASNYTVTADGTYQIYFRRNSDGYDDWHGNTLNVINVTPYTVAFSDGVDSQTVTYGNYAEEPNQPSKENYTFMGWYLDGELYDFDTAVTADITLTAQWKERIVNIQIIDVNGKVKSALAIYPMNNSFENVPIPEIPSAPYLDGYAFTGWTVGENSYSDADALKTALESLVAEEPEDDIIVREVYTQAETLYTVTVNNGTIKNGEATGTFKPSDQVYVTATGGSPEQDFSYWTKQDEGNTEAVIVGYEEMYAFRMPSNNTTLSAVYNGIQTKVGTAYIESVKKTGDAAISFAAVFSVPEGATMLRAGIVACMAGDLDDTTHTAPSMEYARFRRYNDTTCVGAKTFKYTWTKSNITSEDDTWCVCAYLLYEKDGEQYPVYSNMASAKLTDFSNQ